MQSKNYPKKNAKKGDVWFSPNTNHLYRFNGTTWDTYIPSKGYSKSFSTENATISFTQKKQPKTSLWEMISSRSVWETLLHYNDMGREIEEDVEYTSFKLTITPWERKHLDNINRILHMSVSDLIGFKLIITEEERILLEKINMFLHMDVSEAVKTIIN